MNTTPASSPLEPRDNGPAKAWGAVEGGETHRRTAADAARPSAPKTDESPDDVLIIPGDRDQIAAKTAAISPENRPADPKMGPKALRLEVVGLWLVFLAVAVCVGIWVNVFAGAVTLVLGTVGLMFNPVVGAAEKRAEERTLVVEQQRQRDPNDVVVRTTSRRKEERMHRTP